VQVVPKKSVSGLSLCCRWLRPIPVSSTLTSVLVGPTPHVLALATGGTRYSHIPCQPMVPLYCLLLLTRGQSPVGLCGEKPVAAEDWPEPCCLLLCACQGSAKLVQSVWQLQPKLACGVWELLCRTLARLPVAALLTTPHISAWWFAGYLSSYILLMFSCVAVQLVATYHCDQAYAFDVSGTGSCATAYGTTPDSSGAEPGMASDASASDRDAPTDDCMPSTSSIRQVLQHLSLL